MRQELTPAKHAVVRRQVADMLDHSQAFRSMPPAQRAEVARHTTEIVGFLAANPEAASSDPYALGLAESVGGAEGQDFRAQGVREGVDAAAALIDKIDFPQFVAELINGTFKAIVQSSIQQMEAYADLVRSVAMSLNEFRDQNVTQNQGRENLVSRYPNVFQINMSSGQPQVGMRPGSQFAELPDFKRDLGIGEDIDFLDDETIEQTLVPAARDDIARSRQKLLATMVLMGINRIVVTDGKINAKVRFTFSARDTYRRTATDYDYENFGEATIITDDRGRVREGSESTYDQDGALTKLVGGNFYTTGAYTKTTQPTVQLTGMSDTLTEAELTAAGQILGEVSINFKSETFPLERMADTNQILNLQAAQGQPQTAPPKTVATQTANPTQTQTQAPVGGTP